MATREEMERLARQASSGSRTVEAMEKMAVLLGYSSSIERSLDYFFEDNPGAAEAVFEWVLDNYDDELEDEEEDDE